MKTLSSSARRALVAWCAGLLLGGICLSLMLPSIGNVLRHQQDTTRRIIKRCETSLEAYRAKEGRYPATFTALPDYDTVPYDAWRHHLHYSAGGEGYLLTSYGADGKPGGSGLNCDLNTQNLDPPQAQLSWWEILTSPAARGLIIGAEVCGLLTGLLTFGSIRPTDLTRQGVAPLLFKVGMILIAAFFVSAFITAADIPSGH